MKVIYQSECECGQLFKSISKWNFCPICGTKLMYSNMVPLESK